MRLTLLTLFALSLLFTTVPAADAAPYYRHVVTKRPTRLGTVAKSRLHRAPRHKLTAAKRRRLADVLRARSKQRKPHPRPPVPFHR